MKKIFLLTIVVSFITCKSDNLDNQQSALGPIEYFFIRLVDKEGIMIDGLEEKEMQLFVADSNWNILEPQPENYNSWLSNPFYLWGIKKEYNYVGNGKEELINIVIGVNFKQLSYYDDTKDETYGDYVVLQIDENTSLNIQLFYKEFYNRGACIEKYICNGIEYISLESVTYYCDGQYVEGPAGEPKINDIVIE